MRMRLALAMAAASVSLSGCAYDMYGDPYGYGYGYGPYGGVSAGYYSAYHPYGYGYGGYGGYDPFGWYGNDYYPGVGIYVYDSYRRRHVWDDRQRRYWSDRMGSWRSRSGGTMSHENWSGFGHHRGTSTTDRPRRWRGDD